ncbi:MAG: B12-binding domain-containing radical SAM protein [Bacteroidota bacterium]
MIALLVSIPIRPEPTEFPPFGVLSILNYLRRSGVPEGEVGFYHIDGLRPAYEDVLAKIVAARPRVLGVSAVVSTSYAYTKRLVLDVKRALPDTLVVVGGNMAASAEVLLRRAGVDICVAGEGERIFANILKRSDTTLRALDYADIPGLALLDAKGDIVFTGYEAPLEKSEVYDIDWADLEKAVDGDIGRYVLPAFDENGHFGDWSRDDPRIYEPHRRQQRTVSLPASKGCVSRCTFCHRFDKGIRYIPPALVIQRMKYLQEKYDVGFFRMADENFGTDRRWLAQFCAGVKELGVLWNVSGMRVNCVNPDIIAQMKDAGCIGIVYGMETGSEAMLEVMEKKVKLADNYNAVRWTVEAGISTVVQLVIGMPGESWSTVRETAAFASYALTRSASQSPLQLSINFAQALPGTPLYEYMRHHGVIGPHLDDEEAYLLKISDRDAADSSTMNFTGYSFDTLMDWRPFIVSRVNHAYLKQFGWNTYLAALQRESAHMLDFCREQGYFAPPRAVAGKEKLTVRRPNLWALARARRMDLAVYFHPKLHGAVTFGLPLAVVAKALLRGRWRRAWELAGAYSRRVREDRRAAMKQPEFRSLRKVVREAAPFAWESPEARPLRDGR